ncbi:MAG: TdeIII family type II restriction endonuclease [Candidatus Poribacteria bacterium]|nr:TdeIII family type II restriction endonuclease [Candidatus Poribacteria bacterium]
MKKSEKESAIRSIVRSNVRTFANTFREKHEVDCDNPEGVINSKINNIFITVLGDEIRYYTALVRSLDSSLGNTIENMAVAIAELSYEVSRKVTGVIYPQQTKYIAELLEKYKRHEMAPSVKHYQKLRNKPMARKKAVRHESDYYLVNKKTGDHALIEFKIGGDLDIKKARSEKEALLEQFAILSNTLSKNENIKVYFATGYNKNGEGNEWIQGRVRQFFAEDELLIGEDFWNFITTIPNGYDIVMKAYREEAGAIKKTLNHIKKLYI